LFTPRKSQPNIFCTSLFVSCLLLCGIAAATPSITLSKKSGPPTSRILVSGRGFEPNVGVDIYFDTKDEALVVTDGKGEFDNAKAYAPRSAHPGQHWVTALERNNDKGAQEPFLVRTNWSQFHFAPNHDGLNPYENVLNPQTVGNLEMKWVYSVGGVRSSPAVANGVVYVSLWEAQAVDALNAKTGTRLWRHITGNVESSPALMHGFVYVGTEDYDLHALKATTGAIVWSYKTGYYVDASPTAVNEIVYIGSEDSHVYALHARDGARLWSYRTQNSVWTSPAVVNGVVYVGSYDYSVYALNAKTGARIWSYPTGSYIFSSPAVANGVVYIGSDDGNVYALNATTGALLWSYTTSGMVASSPAVANGVIYIGSADGTVYALNASSGDTLWTYSTGGEVNSSPAVANGVVYVASEGGYLYGLNANTGAELWSYPGSFYVDSPPIVADGTVYVGSDFGLYAFGLPRSGGAKQDAASKRPDLKTLRPDFNLKMSMPVTTPSDVER